MTSLSIPPVTFRQWCSKCWPPARRRRKTRGMDVVHLTLQHFILVFTLCIEGNFPTCIDRRTSVRDLAFLSDSPRLVKRRLSVRFLFISRLPREAMQRALEDGLFLRTSPLAPGCLAKSNCVVIQQARVAFVLFKISKEQWVISATAVFKAVTSGTIGAGVYCCGDKVQ